MAGTNPDSLPEELEKAIQAGIDSALKRKYLEYRRIIYAFLLGLGALIVFLLANGLMSERSFLVLLHDQIFGFEDTLNRALRGNVAFSYNNAFWLGTQKDLDQAQTVAFYANKPQRVVALIDLKHFGTGRLHEVTIALDEVREPIWRGSKDLNYARVDLTKLVEEHQHLVERPDSVHFLTFNIDEEGETTSDRVLVRCLINVIGREVPKE